MVWKCPQGGVRVKNLDSMGMKYTKSYFGFLTLFLATVTLAGHNWSQY